MHRINVVESPSSYPTPAQYIYVYKLTYFYDCQRFVVWHGLTCGSTRREKKIGRSILRSLRVCASVFLPNTHPHSNALHLPIIACFSVNNFVIIVARHSSSYQTMLPRSHTTASNITANEQRRPKGHLHDHDNCTETSPLYCNRCASVCVMHGHIAYFNIQLKYGGETNEERNQMRCLSCVCVCVCRRQSYKHIQCSEQVFCECVHCAANGSARTSKAYYTQMELVVGTQHIAHLHGFRLYEPEPKQLNKFLNEL